MLLGHRKHLRQIILVNIKASLRVKQFNRIGRDSHISEIGLIFRVKMFLFDYLITLLLQSLHKFDHEYGKIRHFCALVYQNFMLVLQVSQIFFVVHLVGDIHNLLVSEIFVGLLHLTELSVLFGQLIL